MRTDKLFYAIFLFQTRLITELIPGLPANCEFEYSAPVVKESEYRIDGVFTPVAEDPGLPIVFIEAQMQPDAGFYGRFFAEVHVYLHQYQVIRPWQGLLILASRQHELGVDVPYRLYLEQQVQKLYLEDLATATDLSPGQALLQLIVIEASQTPQAAQNLIQSLANTSDFTQWLDLIEAILGNKFPDLNLEEIRKMLGLQAEDLSHTRLYQDVLQIGRQEGEKLGEQKGESKVIVRQLGRKLGGVDASLENQITSLTSEQLELLGEALLSFQDVSELQAWLATSH
ncbi:DUF2887 domain-containing protein [Synechococcus sp. PCC 6312]|uniref:DUF2887 domain-containing protein n=1 Tax=Synechococcus sp. (strain ATCC 27167 / PCC 6312) TaxID=195253 RepID=UPI00029F3569|nr:DUF2887 domain-containing protein [Synechococcus sp. PCC 6312]AFY61000.1 hypothetical protein Syn6312_1858 [Synechococcus sp. PCC 6312]